MHPDGAGLCRLANSFGNNSQSFAQSGAILPAAQHQQNPPGNKKQESATQKQAVEDIHEGTYILSSTPICATGAPVRDVASLETALDPGNAGRGVVKTQPADG